MAAMRRLSTLLLVTQQRLVAGLLPFSRFGTRQSFSSLERKMNPKEGPETPPTTTTRTTTHSPSQSIVDAEGRTWRLCAAAAVLHPLEKRKILVGQRVGIEPASWQCPQGGVDIGETLQEAAARELYEEMGLVVGQHVEYYQGNQNDIPAVRYETTGTNSWMERAGFVGQELHWTIFSASHRDEWEDPETMCDLAGLNGERPEFSRVQWMDIDEAVEGVWEKKRKPYLALLEFFNGDQEEETEDEFLAQDDDDENARSQFGTRQYWDDVYQGMGDFPKDEYSWYYGWDTLKSHWTSAVPSKDANILIPGVGNDSILLDLFGAGYKKLTAFDYSEHAIERQEDLLSYEPKSLDQVELPQMDGRRLDPNWTGAFDAVLEKGALDAIYLSGDGNVEQAVAELKRVVRPGGIVVSVSGVVPEELRRALFADWEWIRDGSTDLQAGCFILQRRE